MQSTGRSRNVFGIFADLQKIPFAVSRKNWTDEDYAVVTKVIPKGDYGIAHAFPVRNDIPNDHFAYDRQWKSNMVMPNAGSYQWRVIDLPDTQLQKLVEAFWTSVAPQFEFGRPSNLSGGEQV